MKLVDSIEQSIYVNGAVTNNDDFKNDFADRLLEVRDAIYDETGKYPQIGMSRNTSSWFTRLFQGDIGYRQGWTPKFWLMPVVVMDMRDGLIDFYVEE